MTDAVERIKQELEHSGYTPTIDAHGEAYPQVIVIQYEVKNGRLRDKKFDLGISMSGAEGYPEYPPHFIHLSPPVSDPQDGGGVYSTYSTTDQNGNPQQWSVFSRPPGPFWDELPTKGMKSYMEHILRFWGNI